MKVSERFFKEAIKDRLSLISEEIVPDIDGILHSGEDITERDKELLKSYVTHLEGIILDIQEGIDIR